MPSGLLAERFVIRRTLGSGGMGVVYLAHDRWHDSLVAMKTLQHLDGQSLYAFKQEFRSLADLRHRNLVHLWELIGAESQWFFTMEYLNGQDFRHFVRGEHPSAEARAQACEDSRPTVNARGSSSGSAPVGSNPSATPTAAIPSVVPSAPGSSEPPPSVQDEAAVDDATLPIPAISRIVHPNDGGPQAAGKRRFDEWRLRFALGQLAQGLYALHEANRVHRDVKPSNVIVTQEQPPRVVILDFGLVTGYSEHTDQSWAEDKVVGTIPFMAPEQAANERVGPAADWYSFGVMLFEALTGVLPFSGDQSYVLLAKLTRDAPSPSSIVPDLPADLVELCRALLQRDPRLRPSGAEVLRSLGVAPEPYLSRAEAHSTDGERSSVELVGRAAELTLITRLFSASLEEHGQTLVLRGPGGVGKTALITRFLVDAQLAKPDLHVFFGRCYERESVPYKGFDGIIDALGHALRALPPDDVEQILPVDVHLLARIFPTLLRVTAIEVKAGLEPAPANFDVELRARAFAALRTLLGRLAVRRPIVAFIDDLQWADPDSLALLRELVASTRAPRIFLICTVREQGLDEGAAPPDSLGVFDGVERVQSLTLGNLSSEDASRLFVHLLRRAGDADSAEVRRLMNEVQGHPLLIQELASHLSTHQEVSAGGLRLEDAFWNRISRLEVELRRLLELVCVAGAPLPLSLVAHALEVSKEVAWRGMQTLKTHKLVKTSPVQGDVLVEAFHDRVREAAVEHLSPDELREFHLRLVEAYRSGEDHMGSYRLVTHLEGAGLTTEAGREALLAAEQAESTLAFDRAAQMYALALQYGLSDAEQRVELRSRLGSALLNAGRGTEAAEHLLADLGVLPVREQRRRRRLAAEALLTNGATARGLELLKALLAENKLRAPRTPVALILGSLVNQLRCRFRRMRIRTRDDSTIGEDDVERLEVLKVASRQLTFIAPILAFYFRVRALLFSLKIGHRAAIVEGMALEASARAVHGGDKGRLESARYVKIANGLATTPLERYLIQGCEAVALTMFGKYQASAKVFPEVLQWVAAHAAGGRREISHLYLWWMTALRETGEWGTFQEIFERQWRGAQRRGDLFVESLLIRHSNVHWLLKDDPLEAHRQLRRLPWPATDTGFTPMQWFELRARGELALYDGTVTDQLAELRAGYLIARSSLMIRRFQTLRVESLFWWGRVHLANLRVRPGAPESLDEVGRVLRKLRAEDCEQAPLLCEVLSCGLNSAQRDPVRARSGLETVVTLARQRAAKTFEACALYRLGDLNGGAQGETMRAAAERQLGAQRPERFIEVFMPFP